MAKKKTSETVEFHFHRSLLTFIRDEHKKIHATYNPLTRKFLAFNNPSNTSAYLRLPQYEALEVYVFLKEFCENKPLADIFTDWFNKANRFEGRLDIGVDTKGQRSMFSPFESHVAGEKELYDAIFKQINALRKTYPNYIFALTMGLGKTVLMATTIFYEFLLANKYPKDPRYCHNALVFAPDKTVLQSLKEIQTFDKSRVIPPEYVNWLDANLKFHFLDDTGLALNAIDNSMFNIVISNSQKIILKKQSKEKSPSQQLFADTSKHYKISQLNDGFEDLYGFDIDTDQDLATNQRFAKLTRMKQLGIYVDEAHHVFGTKLADDLINTSKSTSLRLTIDMLAKELENAGTHVVGCFNYTGTPYVGSRLLPEVVYAYGLKEAIDNGYLKQVKISGFENIKDQTRAFVRTAISEFWQTFNGKRYENLLPKIAFFASSIDELESELKPAVIDVLAELNIPASKILVNVGDSSITSNDDLREFSRLDTPASDKQFILLVNKGKEGWNCRSLFSVGLHREPKSKVFVLQATMRCLRAIGSRQETGLVFLSDENIRLLNDELTQNFKISASDLSSKTDDKKTDVEVRLVPPPVKVKLKKTRKLHQLKEKSIPSGIDFEFNKVDKEKYKILRSERSITDISKKIGTEKDVSEIKEKRTFSELTLVAEIARYLNKSPLELKRILAESVQGTQSILDEVNTFNELLYDWIIPKLFNAFYDIIEFESKEEIEVELVKQPKEGFYSVHATKELIASLNSDNYAQYASKSFHLDNYCFDSRPEMAAFNHLLANDKVDKVWFTGMLTHGQSDFMIPYIDHESHTLRSYYPDFLVLLVDGSYVILEIKGDNMIDHALVKAKSEYASQLASASQMKYQIIRSSEALNGIIIN